MGSVSGLMLVELSGVGWMCREGDSGLVGAVEREEDISPAFQPEIRGQWGNGQLIPEHVEETGSHCGRRWSGRCVLRSIWRIGDSLFLEWESQWPQWLCARGEVLYSRV